MAQSTTADEVAQAILYKPHMLLQGYNVVLLSHNMCRRLMPKVMPFRLIWSCLDLLNGVCSLRLLSGVSETLLKKAPQQLLRCSDGSLRLRVS